MLEPANEEFPQSVCESYNTNLKQVKQDVQLLKQWLSTQKHLPQCSSDTMLTAFLISSKNSMERAKQKIDNYYSVRGQMPDIFGNRDPRDQRLQEVSRETMWFILPKVTPDGYRVVISHTASSDTKNFDNLHNAKYIMSIEDIRMNQEGFSRGTYYIINCKNLTMSHIFKISPIVAAQLMLCAQDVFPVIIKGLIFINAPTFIDLLINIFKPFMKSKLIQKIQSYAEGPEVLEKYFPRAMLPKDYGGEEETSLNLNESWMKRLEENRDWFLNEGTLKADETKRIKKETGHYQELQGSFKTLCVD